MNTTALTIVVPSSKNDRQKIKMMLAEMTRCMQRMDDEREAKKDIADTLHTDFDLPKKTINKLASTMYKRNYADVQAENSDFEALYDALVEHDSTLSDDTSDE